MSKISKFHLIDPAKSPIFYGYIILIIGTIGIYCSIPGQTIGVSVFTDPVKDALGLSRNQFSNAYMIGTIISSLVIGKAGIWFDKYGARYVAFFAALGLGFTLFLCSWSAKMSDFIKEVLSMDTWMIPFLLMTVLFFMLRFAGQGVLTMASRNVIMIWFDKNRGKVNSVSSVALSFGFSSSPLWINALIEDYGWAHSWQILGYGLLVFSFFVFFLYKISPESHGLLPDGAKSISSTEETKKVMPKQFTLTEAKETRAFWMYGLTLAFNSFFITGLTFHVVSIFANEGFSKEVAISIFLPGSVVAVTVSTIFNFLSDYLSLKLYLYLMLFGGFLASLGFLFLSTSAGVPMLVAGFGILGGFFAVLNAVAWPRFFGRKHLGSITGKIMSFLILASALAPSIFSLCLSTFGSYRLVGYLGLGFLLFLTIAATKANNPQ
ncbi:MFS transporter [Maribacter sp. PR1]|uniref:MFS transporter n=1 Tax=Maribacter cobaltidurans TaxID=1178778 RepID=A0ABU7INT5_9FLAO|nr:MULTISPECIES: MFS transporter [Maribacter]MDC6387100.1 MFS transporter [Maribacter sp. PR1]MEE1974486.1 MFS transporter [Maribacter cobaltidurans]